MNESNNSNKSEKKGCGPIGVIVAIVFFILCVVAMCKNKEALYQNGEIILCILTLGCGFGLGHLVDKKTNRGGLAILVGLVTMALMTSFLFINDETALIAGIVVDVIIAFVVTVFLFNEFNK